MLTYRLSYRRYKLPLRAPLRTAHGTLSSRTGLVIRLQDESGHVGFGEAAPLPGFGDETAEADEIACRSLGNAVEPQALAAVPAELGCLRHALSAAQAPVPATMSRPFLPVAALLPAGRAVLPAVDLRLEAGFRAFKWKVGVGSEDDERALLDDLLGRLPSGAKLRLDANGAWTARTASRWLERCAERPIEHVEQPIASGSRGAEDQLLGLAGDYPTPLALDESLVGADDVERWVDLGWPGIFVIKPSLIGNIDGVLSRLEKAKARVVFSSALETGIGARSALQAAFSWSGEPSPLGFGVWPLFQDERFDGPHAAPFIRAEDVMRINPEAVWTALD